MPESLTNQQLGELRIATGPKVTPDHILVKTYPIFIQFEDYITHVKVIVI